MLPFGAGLFGVLARLYLLVLALLLVAGLFATAFLMRLAWQYRLVTAALLAAALGWVAWLDWRDRQRWRRLLAAAAAHQAAHAGPGGWPLPMPLAGDHLTAVLVAAGLRWRGRVPPAWLRAAAAALRAEGAALLGARLLDRHPELARPEPGRTAGARAYARTFGDDLRWAPYLHEWLEHRFEVGTSLAETEALIREAARRLPWAGE